MKLSICEKSSQDTIFSFVLEKMPLKFRVLITEFCQNQAFGAINEIRIKRNAYLFLIADSNTVKTDIFINGEDIDEIFEYLCNHSYYSCINTLKNGYVPIGSGVRAGISGTAILENNQIIGVNEISSINIRIPQKIPNAAKYVFSLMKNDNFASSILIFSPPGVGKTSILRDLILKLNQSEPPLRFSVIDARSEILTPFMKSLCCDVFTSYPKGVGIELATKSMTPEIIICDEISNEEDANAILKAAHCGVKIIATTHAASIEELLNKSILKELIERGTFDLFLGVTRMRGERKYDFTTHYFKDITKI